MINHDILTQLNLGDGHLLSLAVMNNLLLTIIQPRRQYFVNACKSENQT